MPLQAGGLLLDEPLFVPPSGGGLPVAETWTVANASATLNGDHPWADYIGAHGWNIVSGAAQLENAGPFTSHGGRLVWDLLADDYVVTATIAEYVHSGVGLLTAGPVVRLQGDASLTYYAVGLAKDGAGGRTIQVYRNLAGTNAILTTVSTLLDAGGRLGLRVKGNQLTALANGIPVVTVTDGTIPTGRFCGLLGIAASGNRVRVDDFMAQALHRPVPPELLRQGVFV